MWFLISLLLKLWLSLFCGFILYYLLREFISFYIKKYKEKVLWKSGFTNEETQEAFKKSEKQFWEDIIKGKQDV